MLDAPLKTCKSLNVFKKGLRAHSSCKNNKLFSMFHGNENVNHTRLRLGLSALNSHRFLYGFIPSASCPNCGHDTEDTGHFFFICPAYAALREEMFASMGQIIGDDHHMFSYAYLSRVNKSKCIKLLLYGEENLTFDKNLDIFKAIQSYIRRTHRFL